MNLHANLIPTPKRLAPILGGTLEVVRTKGGRTMVNLRRMCDSVGVDFDSEYERLREAGYGWVNIEVMAARVGPGKTRAPGKPW